MAVTRTVGGVICGYCAIGSRPAAMPPSRTMTIEMTHARTGRSMKKRASTAGLLSGLLGLPGQRLRGRDRHGHQVWLQPGAPAYLLHGVDGPPVGVALLVGQPQRHGEPALAGRVRLALADQLPDAQGGVLVHVEVGV